MSSYGMDAASLYGAAPLAPMPVGPERPTQSMAYAAGDIAAGWQALVDPRNPLVWFGLILAVTLGAAGVSGSVKAGPMKASASVGDST